MAIQSHKKHQMWNILLTSVFILFGFCTLLANETEAYHSSTVTTSNYTSQTDSSASHSEKVVDITAVAFEHILDSHSWHIAGEGHHSIAIPLPIIIYSSTKGLQCFSSSKFEHGHASYNGYSLHEEHIISLDINEVIYDLSLTKNAVQLILSAIFILWLFTSIANTYKKQGVTNAPQGKQSFFEPLIVFVRDDIAKSNIGNGYEKFTPYLLTVFFLVLTNNVFGLIPISANLTGNIAFTLVLSVGTLIITNINGNKHYWHHLLLPPCPKWLYPILIPLEIVGVFSKPFALMIRLFANITAGHIIVISLIGIIFVFKTYYIAPVSVAFTLFIDVLECLVALLQAYIFTMLTALFIGTAVAEPHHEGDGEHTTKH